MVQPWPLASWRCAKVFPPEIPHPASIPNAASSSSTLSNDPRKRCSTLCIFQIPHLIDSICRGLSPSEIWNCYRVSRSWRAAFDQQRFSKVRFADLNGAQTWDILMNAHHIQELQMDALDGEHFFRKSLPSPWPANNAFSHNPPRCINLRKLQYVNFEYACVRPPSYHQHHMQEYSQRRKFCGVVNALDLIGLNPKLESLFVELQWGRERDFMVLTDGILESISNLRYLRDMTIQCALDTQVLALLEHLPESLQDLEIYSGAYPDIIDYIETRPKLNMTKPTGLRVLTLRGFGSTWFHVPLLKHCPVLEEFTVALERDELEQTRNVLIEFCPKIHTIGLEEGNFEESEMFPLVDAYHKGLRGMNVDLGSSPINENHLLLRTLIHRTADTLEHLTLNYNISANNFNVGHLLRSCPRLRSVAIRSYARQNQKGVALHDLLYDHRSGKYTPWVCEGLLELEINIYKTWLTYPVPTTREEKQAQTAHHIGRLFQQLKSLKGFQQFNSAGLRLKWMLTKEMQYDAIPLEIGLGFMVQQGQPTWCRMSRDDLLWMGLSWTPLAEIAARKTAQRQSLVAETERTGCNSSAKWARRILSMPEPDYGDYYKASEREDEAEDWPLRVDRKRVSRAGKRYFTRSLRKLWRS